MQVEEESPKQYVDIARVPDKEMRPERPVPLGLRPGRSSASLPGLTISTYGLRRAPRIRSVLATTHHAPIYEIGSTEKYSPLFTVHCSPSSDLGFEYVQPAGKSVDRIHHAALVHPDVVDLDRSYPGHGRSAGHEIGDLPRLVRIRNIEGAHAAAKECGEYRVLRAVGGRHGLILVHVVRAVAAAAPAKDFLVGQRHG